MPELPEVESVRRELMRSVIGLRVRSVIVSRRDVIEGPDDPESLLEGSVFSDIRRHGKHLALLATARRSKALESHRACAVHLGMTGWLMVLPEGHEPERSDHIHLRWRLQSTKGRPAGELIFRDPRRFGGVRTYASFAELQTNRWSDLGPDATEPPANLVARLLEFKTSTRPIKAALLDQGVLAGVGNIYADEALFAAGIRPQRRVRRVKVPELARLSEALSEILQRAIEAKGSTLRDYRAATGESGGFQDRHQVYGRGRLPCFRCSTQLRSAVVGQRTTVWCPSCQK